MDARPAERPHRTPSRWLIWLGAIALLVGLTALFDWFLPGRGATVSGVDGAGNTFVVLERQRNGHYLASGAINGAEVDFLVDTGATDVAVPQRLARELGLDFGPRVTVMTAAGPVPAWRTRLGRVSVGELALENVRGTISRGPFSEVLLGMSFLRNFHLTQAGDRLVIGSVAGMSHE